MSLAIASVPYLNARPLVRWFRDLGPKSPVEVLFDVPSRLPRLLETGRVSAMLVSSVEALRRPDLSVARGVSIASFGEVMSVRLFSAVPLDQIRRVALDESSMTSNLLAQVVLRKRLGLEPATSRCQPDLDAMLDGHDAAVLIGDNGMREPSGEYEVLDLGHAWHELTGLPFVWALWLGAPTLEGRLGEWLREAKDYGLAHLDEIVEEAGEDGLDPEVCSRYLREVMVYDFGEAERAGFARFEAEVRELGLLPAPAFAE